MKANILSGVLNHNQILRKSNRALEKEHMDFRNEKKEKVARMVLKHA